MRNDINEKNIPAVILFLVLIVCGSLAGISAHQSYNTNKKLDLLLSYVNLPQQEENKQINQNDEFLLLSNKAIEYYDKLGKDKVSGTPTWLVNNNEYKGFDYKNNLIPGFDISEGFKDIILFSSPTCSFCINAETWLKKSNIDYIKVCAPIHPGDFDKCDNTYIK